jgi:3-methyladenine DNA glycosylase/8-oxoguanine DNA glycosylase
VNRLLERHGRQVLVRAWPAAGGWRVRGEAASRDDAAWGIERMRFALCLDHDVSEFHRMFRRDPLLGPSIHGRPWLRPARRPDPFEALVFAITEQLIEGARAVDIQRRLIRRWGGRSDCGLRHAPGAAALAERAPAELAAVDLAPKRAIAMIKVAREVAKGRVDLDEHEPAWLRLRAIGEIGSWTIDSLAFHGQGRDDMLPAGDLAYVKRVGRLAGLGRRATEDEVRSFFAPYEPYQALAGTYLLADRTRAVSGLPPRPARWAA